MRQTLPGGAAAHDADADAGAAVGSGTESVLSSFSQSVCELRLHQPSFRPAFEPSPAEPCPAEPSPEADSVDSTTADRIGWRLDGGCDHPMADVTPDADSSNGFCSINALSRQGATGPTAVKMLQSATMLFFAGERGLDNTSINQVVSASPFPGLTVSALDSV